MTNQLYVLGEGRTHWQTRFTKVFGLAYSKRMGVRTRESKCVMAVKCSASLGWCSWAACLQRNSTEEKVRQKAPASSVEKKIPCPVDADG